MLHVYHNYNFCKDVKNFFAIVKNNWNLQEIRKHWRVRWVSKIRKHTIYYLNCKDSLNEWCNI